MYLKNQCDLQTGAFPAACSPAKYDLTTSESLTLIEMDSAIKEGRVFFRSVKVKKPEALERTAKTK